MYKELLRKTVPRELRDIAILWTERVLEEWYPNVGDWQVYWMQFMPLQWFSKLHPAGESSFRDRGLQAYSILQNKEWETRTAAGHLLGLA